MRMDAAETMYIKHGYFFYKQTEDKKCRSVINIHVHADISVGERTGGLSQK